MIGPMPATIPDVIQDYQAAHDRHYTDIALAAFTADATVLDDGREHHGSAAIRQWLASAASEYTFTRTLLGAEPLDEGRWLVRNHLEGDFPGGEVDLGYEFALTDGLISRLVIAP